MPRRSSGLICYCFAPLGLTEFSLNKPTACVVGCMLSPLRGWEAFLHGSLDFTRTNGSDGRGIINKELWPIRPATILRFRGIRINFFLIDRFNSLNLLSLTDAGTTAQRQILAYK